MLTSIGGYRVANETDADTQKRRNKLHALEMFKNTVRPIGCNQNGLFRNSPTKSVHSIRPVSKSYSGLGAWPGTIAGVMVMQSIENTHSQKQDDGDAGMIDVEIKPTEFHRMMPIR